MKLQQHSIRGLTPAARQVSAGPGTGGTTNTSARRRRKGTIPRSKPSNRSTRPWRTTHSDALHKAGRRAEVRFREVEQMQVESQPAYPLLYSLRGFQYCDLLLADPERAAWQRLMASGGRQPTDRLPRTTGSLALGADEVESVGLHPPLAEEFLATCRDVFQRAAQTLK